MANDRGMKERLKHISWKQRYPVYNDKYTVISDEEVERQKKIKKRNKKIDDLLK